MIIWQQWKINQDLDGTICRTKAIVILKQLCRTHTNHFKYGSEYTRCLRTEANDDELEGAIAIWNKHNINIVMILCVDI